jgi:hypothetical protein
MSVLRSLDYIYIYIFFFFFFFFICISLIGLFCRKNEIVIGDIDYMIG